MRPQKCNLTPPRAHLRLETDDFGTLPPESQKMRKKLSGCPDIKAFEATSSQNALVSRARRRLIGGNCLIIAVIVVIAYFNYHRSYELAERRSGSLSAPFLEPKGAHLTRATPKRRQRMI